MIFGSFDTYMFMPVASLVNLIIYSSLHSDYGSDFHIQNQKQRTAMAYRIRAVATWIQVIIVVVVV